MFKRPRTTPLRLSQALRATSAAVKALRTFFGQSVPQTTHGQPAPSPPSRRTAHTDTTTDAAATDQAHDRSPAYSPADRSTRIGGPLRWRWLRPHQPHA